MERPRLPAAVGAALLLTSCFVGGCATSPPDRDSVATAAVDRVLSEDARLGSARNLAPHDVPLHRAVLDYVEALGEVDTEECPEPFVEALERHRSAWLATVPFLERHADLRGEMHELFDRIRATSADDRRLLEAYETLIWSTWAEVEAASR